MSNNEECKYLPEVKCDTLISNEPYDNLESNEDSFEGEVKVIGDSPCPCCGFIIIPNKGDALADEKL